MHAIGPVSVSYPVEVRNAVNRVMWYWQTFCRLPSEEKKKFILIEDERYSDAGYQAPKEGGDAKEVFMLTGAQGDRLLKCSDDPKANSFLVNFFALQHTLDRFLANYIQRVGSEFLPYGDVRNNYVHDTLASSNQWTWRFLHYPKGSTQEILASAHPDKGGVTAHLSESAPGLEWMDVHGVWRPMEMDEGATVIIPGMQFQYISQNQAKAVWHRVVSNDETRRHGRYALVVFIHTVGVPVYNKKKAGRTQDLIPGSTYTMPWEEIQKMFIL